MNSIEWRDAELAPEFDGKALLRRAAETGPGYRGRREPASLEKQAALAQEITQAGERPPPYLGASTQWIDRRAKLFESGNYPDKGVQVTPEDLKRLSDGFDLPVPVLIEHADSPLEIGFLTDVEAVGAELYGNLALTEEANALIEKSGAKSLSLGLSKDLGEIREVSLVRTPRVPSARLFAGEVRFWAELESNVNDPIQGPEDSWRARFQALSHRVEQEGTDRKLEQLVLEGRVVPSQLPYAKALLRISDSIDFDGESRPVHQLLIAMLERQPPHGLFSEAAPAGPAGSEALFLPEEAEFYRRHFPDVSLDVIAARRGQPAHS